MPATLRASSGSPDGICGMFFQSANALGTREKLEMDIGIGVKYRGYRGSRQMEEKIITPQFPLEI